MRISITRCKSVIFFSSSPCFSLWSDTNLSIAVLFSASCVDGECHGGTSPVAGLPLDGRLGMGRFVAAYETLITLGYVEADRRRARESPLIERLLGEELDAPAPVTGRCPPEGADPALVETVVRWIELGAFYDLGAP